MHHPTLHVSNCQQGRLPPSDQPPQEVARLDLSAGHTQATLCFLTCFSFWAQSCDREVMESNARALLRIWPRAGLGQRGATRRPEAGAALGGHLPLSRSWGSFWPLLSPANFSPTGPGPLLQCEGGQGRAWAGVSPGCLADMGLPVRHPTWASGFVE